MNIIDIALIVATITLLAWIATNRVVWVPAMLKLCVVLGLRRVSLVLLRMRKPQIMSFIEKWALADITLQFFTNETDSVIQDRSDKMEAEKLILQDLDYTKILGDETTIKLALHEDEMLKHRIIKMLKAMEALEKQLNLVDFSPSGSIRMTYKKTLFSLGIR